MKKTQQEKIIKAEALFDQIKKLFPESRISLSIHGIDMEQLPKNWHVTDNYLEDVNHHYITANRNGENFDITLFS